MCSSNDINYQSVAKDFIHIQFGETVKKVEQLGGGKNSLVFKLHCDSLHNYIAKFYFKHKNDYRDRLGAEFSALKYLNDCGIECVPKAIVCDPEQHLGIYEYIDGSSKPNSNISDKEVSELICFLKKLKSISIPSVKNPKSGNASEACFSFDTVLKTVNTRFNKLCRVTDEKLNAFLINDFNPVFQEILDWCKHKALEYQLSWIDEISHNQRFLSPSDLGFHNTITSSSGKIYFIDFEYFGWDDPAKLVCDFLLHPGFNLKHELKKLCLQEILEIFKDDQDLKKRIKITYPLHGLNWCLRMLNEYLNDHVSRRQFAAKKALQVEQRQKEQLKKSKKLLNKTAIHFSKFPYE